MVRGYRRCMKRYAACLTASLVVFSSCKERTEMTVTETRPATTRDVSPKLNASSDERFRDAKPSPVKGSPPENWLVLPASQFRILNYRFGESGMGEVWVSLSAGTVLDNVNRWLGQFGEPALSQEAFEKLPVTEIAGVNGVWVSAAGEYAAGMGAPPQPGFALAGVVASLRGEILTVKMVGPKAEVEAEKPALAAFVASLRMAE
jgi:hypothetical protein